MKLNAPSLALIAIALLTPFATASADQLGVDFTGTNGHEFTNGSWTLGYDFSVASSVTVDGLAVFNPNHAVGGLPVSDAVGLWDSQGNLLASGVVAAGTTDTLDPFFAEVAISPVVLGPGSYIVGAQNNGLNYTFFTAGFTVAPGITFNNSEEHSGAALQEPTFNEGITAASGGGIFGGNIVLGSSAVPDSGSSWALALIGLAGLAVASRFKRATA